MLTNVKRSILRTSHTPSHRSFFTNDEAGTLVKNYKIKKNINNVIKEIEVMEFKPRSSDSKKERLPLCYSRAKTPKNNVT